MTQVRPQDQGEIGIGAADGGLRIDKVERVIKEQAEEGGFDGQLVGSNIVAVIVGGKEASFDKVNQW